jgi:hypothetical protein
MATPALAQSGSIHRVRSEKPAIAALIDEGIARSPTFASLVAAIDRTDGLIYVEEGRCGRSVRACLVMTVTIAGPYRMLRIRLGSRRPRRDLIASLGHELRHVIEVLHEPGIRTNAAFYHFFHSTQPTATEAFESSAAIQVGLDVHAELGLDP